MTRRLGWTLVLISVLLAGAGGSVVAAPVPQHAEPIDEALRDYLPADWALVRSAVVEEQVTVCLALPLEILHGGEERDFDEVEQTVARILLPFSWRSLYVQAVDPETGACKGLLDFLPQEAATTFVSEDEDKASITPATSASATAFPHSLSGKTIFISAGHGWQWNGYAWRTQRPPYQEIIEDHNNAEAVNQYLIPYLEQAGATVIPVRERDWNPERVIADNDDVAVYAESGSWSTSPSFPGYDGGTYRFSNGVNSPATATATWTLSVPQMGHYALYTWVYPGVNRVSDARYTVHHAGGTTEVRLDQRIRKPTWRYLGTFPFYAGTTTVGLDNQTADDLSGGGKVVIADALRLGGGSFDDLRDIDTTAPSAPNLPWWETATFYYSQWMGMEQPYGDVTARPIFARWNHEGVDEDAIYISWHSNGYNGDNDVIWGTVSYVHNQEGYPLTEGSLDLQNAIHTELVDDIRAGWDPNWRDLGKRALNLGELRLLWDDNPDTRMPGVLLELAYHDHVEDANALKDPRFNQIAARAIYQGILRYFAGQDGVELPEPPEALRVQNQGGGAVRIAWDPSPTDGVELRGDAATGYRVYTSPDSFAWGEPIMVAGTQATLTGLPEGETRYIKVTATNDGGESLPTEVLGVRVGDDPPLLIVNGYDKLNRFGLVQEVDPIEGPNLRMFLEQINSRDYVVHHGEATPATYAWDSASNEAVIAGQVTLGNYAMVDWILGEESVEEDSTLNATERSRLTTFLGNGGALLISGTELAWELESEGLDPTFLHTTLKTDYVGDDAATYTVSPLAGGAFEGLANFAFNAPGEYDADFSDVLAPWAGSGATAALSYVGGTAGTAGVQYANGCERVLTLGFPLETVRPESRGGVMAKALDFLDQCVDHTAETGITAPASGSYHKSAPAFSGWASGTDLQRVELQLVRHIDGMFWSGSTWGAAASWFITSGVTDWSYTPPALTDSAYTLQARSVATAPDGSPAQVTFTMDTLAPSAPLLITPTDGITVTGGGVDLQWQAPADSGSPLHYLLSIDGITRTVESTLYSVALGMGQHTWRVKGVDAAGNEGPWSMEEVFGVTLSTVHLPLVVRGYMPGTPPPDENCSTILDDGFEELDGWSYNSASGAHAERVSMPVYEGDWSALVGVPAGEAGGGSTAYASISRGITLPAGANTITLNFWAYPIAEANDPGDLHYVGLRDGANTWYSLSSETVDGWTWEPRSLDLTPYAGQTVTLYIGSKNDGDDETAALYLDAVQVEVCLP